MHTISPKLYKIGLQHYMSRQKHRVLTVNSHARLVQVKENQLCEQQKLTQVLTQDFQQTRPPIGQ